MKIVVAIILGALVACCTCLDQETFEVCGPNRHCSQLRGKISYDYQRMSALDRHLFKGRSWIIKPQNVTKSTVAISFKDFNIHQVLYVAISTGRNIQWKHLAGKPGDQIDLVVTGVTSVSLYVPTNEKGSFKAYFYIGCEVLTTDSGEISFPTVDDVMGLSSTCWIIKPVTTSNFGRVYFTFRDVVLIKGTKITIQEAHSSDLIASVNETASFDIFASDTHGQETFVVDLYCNEKASFCQKFGNVFALSYYTLNRSEVACIETQRQCAFESRNMSEFECSDSCPILDYMIEEEIVKEGPLITPQDPIPKSGVLPTAMRINQALEAQQTKSPTITNDNDVTEGSGEGNEEKEPSDKNKKPSEKGGEVDEPEEVEEGYDSRLGPKPKPIRCPLRGKYCKCLRNQNDARKYCFSKRKCQSFGFCAIGCVWARFMVCAKMTSSASVKLLQG